ncbi:MAG: KpsF/GutQ family sugar-phosphate isomerase [Planctomycetes bacterium]|nr:KpsF/GutQ family sugar-phosphate isomerase [Planctomycetota bacterium]
MSGSRSATRVTVGDLRADEREFVLGAIRAEAEAVQRLPDELGDELHQAIDVLEACHGHVVTTGMGKSGLIAQKLSSTMASIGVPSHFVHPAEAVHGDLGRIRADDVLLAMSYSGNTDEVVALATLVKPDGIPVVGMSSNPVSELARLSTVHLSIGDVMEACPLNLAPTASTTAMLALGDAVALAVSRRRQFTVEDYRKRHPGGLLGKGLKSICEVLRFRVGENLPTIPAGVTVREALDRANVGRRPGAMLIVDADDGRLVGIFTDGDLRRLVLAHPDALDRKIAAVMTAEPRCLQSDALVRDTVQLVREHRQDEIPVVDKDGRPIGLLDVQDLIAMKVIDE